MSWWHRACTYFCTANVSFHGHNLPNSPIVEKGHGGLCVSLWQQPKCKNAYPCMWTLQIKLDLFCRFLFRSGNQEHPGDKIENTTVEILPVSVGKYFPHTHTYCLSTLCGVMCKRFWLDYTERLLFGTKRIDYRQECERDWIVCSATGDAFWHCDSHMLGICSSAAQMRK